MINERMRQARKDAGLTQGELGEKVGLTAASVNRIENGQATPRLEAARDIAAALGKSVEDLWPKEQVA